MAHPTSGSLSRQVTPFRQQFLQAPGLPLAEHLPAPVLQEALDAVGVSYRDRLFSPFVTLWVFLSQILDADPSCQQAVTRWLAFRAAQGLPPASSDTGAYCKARQRLPEAVLARLTRTTG